MSGMIGGIVFLYEETVKFPNTKVNENGMGLTCSMNLDSEYVKIVVGNLRRKKSDGRFMYR
jgi:hypothetical protein